MSESGVEDMLRTLRGVGARIADAACGGKGNLRKGHGAKVAECNGAPRDGCARGGGPPGAATPGGDMEKVLPLR